MADAPRCALFAESVDHSDARRGHLGFTRLRVQRGGGESLRQRPRATLVLLALLARRGGSHVRIPNASRPCGARETRACHDGRHPSGHRSAWRRFRHRGARPPEHVLVAGGRSGSAKLAVSRGVRASLHPAVRAKEALDENVHRRRPGPHRNGGGERDHSARVAARPRTSGRNPARCRHRVRGNLACPFTPAAQRIRGCA